MDEDDVCPHGKPPLFCFQCYDSQPAGAALPGCMAPDGAEPCRAYQDAIARAEAAERERAALIAEVWRLEAEEARLRKLMGEAVRDFHGGAVLFSARFLANSTRVPPGEQAGME